MDAKKENDILEKTLAIAESGYPEAYQFLMDAYEACPESYGPQTLYFLSCLAGGTDKKTDVLMWLKKAISDCGWWYRPEVLEDDDLGLLKDEQEFLSLKAVSDARYAEAAASSKACFSWMKKTAENLFLAVHGNTQNAETARADWETVLAGKDCWQIETIQSGEPRTDTEPIDGAMTKLRICRWQTRWKLCRTRGMEKSCVADFLPDAICFFVRLPLRRRAAMC